MNYEDKNSTPLHHDNIVSLPSVSSTNIWPPFRMSILAKKGAMPCILEEARWSPALTFKLSSTDIIPNVEICKKATIDSELVRNAFGCFYIMTTLCRLI